MNPDVDIFGVQSARCVLPKRKLMTTLRSFFLVHTRWCMGTRNKLLKFMKICFPPIADKNAKVLILGTMPGEESLRNKQYYAHPRNAFWYIMERLLNIDSKVSYEERQSILKVNHIALWDVLMSCEREGSLDSSIRDTSIVTNDFALFFSEHPHIKSVYFNGARAEQEYMKRVLPVIADVFKGIEYFRLPSTSPAMARLTKDKKFSHWSIIMDKLKH